MMSQHVNYGAFVSLHNIYVMNDIRAADKFASVHGGVGTIRKCIDTAGTRTETLSFGNTRRVLKPSTLLDDEAHALPITASSRNGPVRQHAYRDDPMTRQSWRNVLRSATVARLPPRLPRCTTIRFV